MKTVRIILSAADYQHLIDEAEKPAKLPNKALMRAARRYAADLKAGRIKVLR